MDSIACYVSYFNIILYYRLMLDVCAVRLTALCDVGVESSINLQFQLLKS